MYCAAEIIGRLSEIPSAFAVYQVSDSRGSVRYVGLCALRDFMYLPDARSNSKFVEIFDDGREEMTLRLLYIEAEAEDARKRQYAVISANSADCNRMGYTIGARPFRIMCNETGEVFPSLTATAKAHRIAQGNLSRHLAGQAGYRKLLGRSYRYC